MIATSIYKLIFFDNKKFYNHNSTTIKDYKNTLLNYNLENKDVSMYLYTIAFKFMWVLNTIGSFNVTSIYVPKLDICNIKIINLIFGIDILSDKLLKYLSS